MLFQNGKTRLLHLTPLELLLWGGSCAVIVLSYLAFSGDGPLSLAAYLTFRRSAFFALAYAANDLVLIVLWTLALRSDSSALAMLVCFCAFGANDLYGFVSWLRMEKRQSAVKNA